ncbi:hypothetical protein [Anaerosporobacter faecicola]|uniref:hypothetical protein n=1 Tax=Anaerosporobacter faecicola TaxID=2718714 RepID=UPI001438E7B5|nr:hypothetical protein [Anaerosporobacter faecicola]
MKTTNFSNLSEQDKDLVVGLYQRGVKNKDIIGITKVSEKCIYAILKEKGIKKKTELQKEAMETNNTNKEDTQEDTELYAISKKLDIIIDMLRIRNG